MDCETAVIIDERLTVRQQHQHDREQEALVRRYLPAVRAVERILLLFAPAMKWAGLVLLSLIPVAAAAQTPPTTNAQTAVTTNATATQWAAEPDVAILTSVRARELRFEQTGEARITVWGEVNGRPAVTVSRTDRHNLPEEVETRVLYRDIGILLTITSTLPNIEQIVDEALGITSAPPPAPDQKRDTPQKR
jgi:hypothetical protein